MTIDVTVTLGMPGSASTWAYNVVRELRLVQHGGRNVEAFYSDAVSRVRDVFRDNQHLDRHVIWKLHEPDESWPAFLAENQVTLVLSLRDPRDAMLSLMERFGADKDGAFTRVMHALQGIAECMVYPHVSLRYEDRSFDQPATVNMLARSLGVTIADADRDRIFATYQTETIRDFARTLNSLPADRVRRIEGLHYDEVTQIHGTHIGDQRIGKWRDRFDAEDRRLLTARFKPFLQIFDYEIE